MRKLLQYATLATALMAGSASAQDRSESQIVKELVANTSSEQLLEKEKSEDQRVFLISAYSKPGDIKDMFASPNAGFSTLGDTQLYGSIDEALKSKEHKDNVDWCNSRDDTWHPIFVEIDLSTNDFRSVYNPTGERIVNLAGEYGFEL